MGMKYVDEGDALDDRVKGRNVMFLLSIEDGQGEQIKWINLLDASGGGPAPACC